MLTWPTVLGILEHQEYLAGRRTSLFADRLTCLYNVLELSSILDCHEYFRLSGGLVQHIRQSSNPVYQPHYE